MGFDATLTKPEVVKILHELAETSTTEKKEGDNESGAFFFILRLCIITGYTLIQIILLIAHFTSVNLFLLLTFVSKPLIRLSSYITLYIDEEENVSNLCMEATMPLEQVMAKYKSEMLNTHIKSLKGEKCGKRAFASPFLRGRREREKAICSSLGAGCSSTPSPPSSSSSTMTAWNTNETDVSSSSQPCGSTLSSTVERKESECPGNEAEQVLDSTTSNGNAAHVSPPVGSTADVEPAKSMDMPDSSEDVKEKVSSPGKTPPCAESNANEVEVNGAELKRVGDADSSKGGGDNVSSSSCTPVENGDAGQQERITSSGRRRVQSVDLYQSLLKKDSDDSEEDEDDDENDETFDGVPERYRTMLFNKQICDFKALFSHYQYNTNYKSLCSDEDDTEDIDEDETDDDEEIEEEDIDDSDEDRDVVINLEKVQLIYIDFFLRDLLNLLYLL